MKGVKELIKKQRKDPNVCSDAKEEAPRGKQSIEVKKHSGNILVPAPEVSKPRVIHKMHMVSNDSPFQS